MIINNSQKYLTKNNLTHFGFARELIKQNDYPGTVESLTRLIDRFCRSNPNTTNNYMLEVFCVYFNVDPGQMLEVVNE